MIKRYHEAEDDGATLDLTPLLDVVFILLIFFIVTSTFVSDAGIPVHRPAALTAEDVDVRSIAVSVGAQGEVSVQGDVVDLRLLRSHLQRNILQPEAFNAVIYADRLAPSGITVQVVDQLRLLGISRIAIATDKVIRDL